MDFYSGNIPTGAISADVLSDIDYTHHNLTEAEKERILFQRKDEEIGARKAADRRRLSVEHSTRGLFNGPGIG